MTLKERIRILEQDEGFLYWEQTQELWKGRSNEERLLWSIFGYFSEDGPHLAEPTKKEFVLEKHRMIITLEQVVKPDKMDVTGSLRGRLE
jgi:hypothetical protein